MLTVTALNGLRRISHAFFTREGGVSDGLFASLNCGFGSGDDPKRVCENRDRAMGYFGLAGKDLNTVCQVQSAEVAVVEQTWTTEQRPQADAVVTRRPGIALGILSADCAPVLFADAKAGVIGAAHAGWRGAKAGVLEATVDVMTRLGATPMRITAAVGPCIARESYEVGNEFLDEFIAESTYNARFFSVAPREGHFMFDLPGYTANRLAALGLGAVDSIIADTCGDEARFFSYRRATQRGETAYGLGLSTIVMET